MSEIFYWHQNKSWVKECHGHCGLSFEIQAINIIEAAQLMREYFHSGKDSNALCNECKSCANDRRRGRKSNRHRDEVLEEQKGKCGLCYDQITFKNRTANVDHCHISGVFRKILCTKCNMGMAHIDNDEWLIKAIAYRDSYRFPPDRLVTSGDDGGTDG